MKISVNIKPDKSYELSEKFKTCYEENFKTVIKNFPKPFNYTTNENAGKEDYGFAYKVYLMNGGRGYVAIKRGYSYECYEDDDLLIGKYFLKNGCLVEKMIKFAKMDEGCVDGSGAWVFILKNKNWLVSLKEKELQEGQEDYPFPGENSVYDLESFEPLKSISPDEWKTLVNKETWEFFNDWLKENTNFVWRDKN